MKNDTKTTKREEKIIDDITFIKMEEPKDKLALETSEYYVDDEKKIICLQDQPVKLRDNVTIYTDIYLPKMAAIEPVPLIVNWSLTRSQLLRPNTSHKTLSQIQIFEALDPLYWCHQGYAVANANPRGIGPSEGDFKFGTQDGKDGFDFIEWAAVQKWCNGKVALFGSSNGLTNQWAIAKECPPHLVSIAPFNASGNLYNLNYDSILNIQGRGYIENIEKMAKKEIFLTSPYWQDKIAKYEDIDIPVYMACTWNHSATKDAWETFRTLKTENKWINCYQELKYDTKTLDDLKLFFDRYLKVIHNAWESTPKVRFTVMDALEYPYDTNRYENAWPLARTNYKKLYLNASSGKMGDAPVKNSNLVSFDAKDGETTFEYTFRKDTELTGHLKLRLWVEVENHDDMDLVVEVKKLSTQGEEIPLTKEIKDHFCVSLRHIDEAASTDYYPVYTYDRTEKLSPKDVTPIDIAITPLSRFWHKGQKIQLHISGQQKGRYIIRTGGKYESYLLIPEIPPKYVSGEYTYR